MHLRPFRLIPIFFLVIFSVTAQITVVSSATFQPAVAPASIVAAFGNNLATQQTSATLDQNGNLPTTLAGTSVSVNGQAASLIFVSPTQINFVIPAGTATGNATVTVTGAGSTQSGTALVQLTAPGIYTIPCLRPDRGAIENAITGALEPFRATTPENPGSDKRTILSVFGTGIRYAGNASRDPSDTNVSSQVTATVTDENGNTYTPTIQYAGKQPTLEGLDQLNIILPATVEGVGTVEIQFGVAGQNSNSVSFVMSTTSAASGQATNLSISTAAGSGTMGKSGDAGRAVAAQLNSPSAVAFDGGHNMYIADTGNHTVRRVDGTGTISTFAGTGVAGSSGDGGPAASATLTNPVALAFDGQGNLLIVDSGSSSIRKVTPSGTISTAAGTGVAGFAGDGGAATSAQLNAPSGIAVSSSGTMVVADTGNNRIRRITTDGLISTVAGTNTAGINTTSSAYLATLNHPTGVAVDSQGNIFVADAGNFILRRIATDGSIFTIGGTGTQGSTGTNCPATQASFSTIAHLAADSSGRLWVSDTNNNKVRLIDSGCYITDAAGTGAAGYSGDGGSATQAQINTAAGLTVDALGNVYFADTGNQRVRELSANGNVVISFLPPTPAPGQTVVGLVSTGGNTGGGTLQISSSVPTSGLPSFLTIPSGLSGSSFTFTAPSATTPTPVAVNVSGAGLSGSGSFTVTPPVSGSGAGIGSVSIAPGVSVGGLPVLGTVALTAAAPAGGTMVALTSSSPVASVAPSITIPQGLTSGQFLVSTTNPTTGTPATISASTGGSKGSALLMINPGVSLSGISVSPASLTGGQTGTGTVSLNAAAGSGGANVALSSNTPSVTVPSTVTVPAGAVSATFPVQTSAVTAPVSASITGTSSNVAVGGLNLLPLSVGQVPLSGISLNPSSLVGGLGSTGTVTLASPAPAPGATVNLQASSPAVTVPSSITIPTGQTSGTFPVQTSPVSLLTNASVTASSANSVSSPLTLTVGAQLPSISGVSVGSNSLTGGQGTSGTVSLSAAAPSGGVSVGLSSNSPAVSVPASVQVQAGQTSATFPVTTVPVLGNTTASITANGTNSQSTPVTVNAPCVSGLNLQLTPNGLPNPGGVISGTVNLNGAAASPGASVQLTAPGASLGSVLVPAGQSSATVNLGVANAAQLIGSSVTATTGSCGGISATI